LAESIFVGLGATIPVIFIGLRRGNPTGSVLSASFIGFLVFFIFNVLMEFSGQNDLKPSSQVIAEEKAIFWPVLIGSGIIGLVLTVIAFLVRNFDMCVGEALLESVVFAFFNTAPFVYAQYNRGERNVLTIIGGFLKYFFAFMIGCLMLQAGGFWSGIFPLSGEMKQKYSACSDITGLRFTKNSTETIAQSFGGPSGDSSLLKKLS
jgi:hypothetical protein